MKYKPIKFNCEQRKAFAGFFYDVGKLSFAATAVDAYVRGGVSTDKSLVGIFATLLFVVLGLKIQEGVNND